MVWYENQEQFSLMLEHEPRITFENGYAEIETDSVYKYYYNEYEFFEESYRFSIRMADFDYATSDYYTGRAGKYRLTVEERDYEGYTPAENILTPVKDLKVDEKQKPMFRIDGGKLVVKGLKEGADMVLYSVDGKELGKAVAGSDGKAQLALPHTRTAVVVKAGNVTFKIGVK